MQNIIKRFSSVINGIYMFSGHVYTLNMILLTRYLYSFYATTKALLR